MQTEKATRNLTLDVIRIIAVLSVVMIHCSAKFVSSFDDYSIEFTIGNIVDSLSRIGVPLFVMTSGALLLDERKQITVKDVFLKYIKNILVLIVVWAAVYSLIFEVIKPLRAGEAVSVTEAIIAVGKGHYHMWYLYMTAGMYLMLPFLKLLARKENRSLVLLYIGIAMLAQFTMPLLDALTVLYSRFGVIKEILENTHMDFFGGYVAYFLTGWYIVHIGVKNRKARMGIYLAGILSAAFIIVYTQLTKEYENPYSELGLPVFLYSTSVFLALNRIKVKSSGKMEKTLVTLSKLTFGVYIVHAYFLEKFRELFPYNGMPVRYLAACFFAVLSVSLAVSYVLSKIPVVKKIVRM